MFTRRSLEESAPALATSIDGRRFSFQTSLHGLQLKPGAYVTIGADRLGQVHSLEQALIEPIWDESSASPGSIRVAVAQGVGSVLDGPATPFHEEALAGASATVVDDWLRRTRPHRAALDVGELALEPSVRFQLDAGGFDRHTFFCGQSGSGKTYALGAVLERLLTETSIRIVVLDPNSDFVRLDQVRPGVAEEVASGYRSAAQVDVRRAGASGAERLHVRFPDCDANEQAAALRLDPIADRQEYGALVDGVEAAVPQERDAEQVMEGLLAATDEHQRALGARLRNLGLHQWAIWSHGDPGSVQDLVAPGGPRCVVLDIGSLHTRGEQALAAESALAALWRSRASRQPVLIVIDEAHNVCPREPADPVTALATDVAGRIAAEGRKFGLYLLVSTQRPQRVHELVVSQCDNLVLMRMNAAGDLAYLQNVLSFAPRPLLEQATTFRLGEALVAGKIASHPTLVRFGPRIAEEGGSDVPATWAARAQPS